MTLDIAMGGSTNTVLHLLAAAHEGEIDFIMDDIDALSRKVPVLCKVAPPSPTCTWKTSTAPAASWPSSASSTRGLLNTRPADRARPTWRSARPLGYRARPARACAISSAPRRAACRRRSPSARPRAGTNSISTARTASSARSNIPFSKDGGLAVLFGNLALDGCIVKTAGVDESILKFTGPAASSKARTPAVKAILSNKIKAGDVVVIRYEGRAAARACRRCCIRPAI
jgi:dihydroxy-acid dehydratase